MPPTIGKRVKNRFRVLNCNVRLESKGRLGLFKNQIRGASLIDLSTTGIQVVAFEMLVARKQYDISIYTPAFNKPISTRGRIVWQKPYDGKDQKKYYRIGLEFTYFKGKAMEKLEALDVNHQLRKIN